VSRVARKIRSLVPEAKIISLEIYSEPLSDGRDQSGDWVGIEGHQIESFIRNLNTPIDIISPHWYIQCFFNSDLNGDGKIDDFELATPEEGLAWNENFDLPSYIKSHYHSYSLYFPSRLKEIMNRYSMAEDAEIGVGELNVAIGCDSATTMVNDRVSRRYGSVLVFLETLPLLAENGVAYVNQFDLVSTWRGAFFNRTGRQADGYYLKYSHAYAYEFLTSFFGMKVVRTSNDRPDLVGVHASYTDENQLRILLVNKTEAVRNIRIRLDNINLNSGQKQTQDLFQIDNNLNQDTGIQIREGQPINLAHEFDVEIGPYRAKAILTDFTPTQPTLLEIVIDYNLFSSQADINSDGIVNGFDFGESLI